jgi:hypothetical protein
MLLLGEPNSTGTLAVSPGSIRIYPGLVHLPLLQSVVGVGEGKPEAQVACLEFLRHRGCQCSANGQELVWSAGQPEVLRYCPERVLVRRWDDVMDVAIANVLWRPEVYADLV